MALQDFSPNNPRRSLDWRWARAGNVVEGGPPLSRRRDDAWITRAYRFRCELESANEYGEYLLSEKAPDVYWAYDLYRRRESVAGRTDAHLVEALVLADVPPDRIGDRINAAPEVVEAYERLFFDARPHLGKDYYINLRVFGDALCRGLSSREYDMLWKMYAYYRGEHMLDLLVSGFTERSKTTPDRVNAAAGMAFRDGLTRSAMVAAATLQVNGFTACPIIDLYLRACADQQSGGAGANAAILDNVAAAMTSIRYTVGAPPRYGRTQLDELDDAGGELRTDELMRASAGMPVGRAELDAPFPAPRPAALPAPAAAG